MTDPTTEDPTAALTLQLPLGGTVALNRVAIVEGEARVHITLSSAGTADAWLRTADLVALHTAAAVEVDALITAAHAILDRRDPEGAGEGQHD